MILCSNLDHTYMIQCRADPFISRPKAKFNEFFKLIEIIDYNYVILFEVYLSHFWDVKLPTVLSYCNQFCLTFIFQSIHLIFVETLLTLGKKRIHQNFNNKANSLRIER